jgi:hypothetical protein
MSPPPTDELNALRTSLHRFGQANWVGRSTTTHAQQLQIAQACVDALDQFDKYEAEIERLTNENAALKLLMYGTPENPRSYAWLESYVAACENELKRASERRRQEMQSPHCSSCSCEPLPPPPDVQALRLPSCPVLHDFDARGCCKHCGVRQPSL